METSSWRCRCCAAPTEGCVVGIGELTASSGCACAIKCVCNRRAKSCKAAMFCALLVINMTFSTRAAGQLGVASGHSSLHLSARRGRAKSGHPRVALSAMSFRPDARLTWGRTGRHSDPLRGTNILSSGNWGSCSGSSSSHQACRHENAQPLLCWTCCRTTTRSSLTSFSWQRSHQ